MEETWIESIMGHACVCNEPKVGVDIGVRVRVRRRNAKSGHDC